jgi:two-component system cell cycle sensor histidine kinase/response regulator CckA
MGPFSKQPATQEGPLVPDERAGVTAGKDPELARAVSLLLSTQQDLIDIRHRRDRERRVLEGIAHLSERLDPLVQEGEFWAAIADAAIFTFECESLFVLETPKRDDADFARPLVSLGPVPIGEDYHRVLRLVLEQSERGGSGLVETDEHGNLGTAAGLGRSIATLMHVAVQPTDDPRHLTLVGMVSARKKAFFPNFDDASLPGFRVFANQVSTIWSLIRARHLAESHLRELHSSHQALGKMNQRLSEKVAEQTQTALALQSSEEKYRGLFQTSNTGLALLDQPTLTVSEANEALQQLFEIDREPLRGRKGIDLFAESDQSRELFRALVEPEATFEGDLALVDGDATVPVSVSLSALVSGGTGGMRLVAVTDLRPRLAQRAERLELQRELESARQMESLGRLAGGIAHDFNNLLTIIVGKVSTLSMDPGLSVEGSETISDIEQAVRRARELTRQLLLFGRQQVVDAAGSDLDRMIQDSLGFLKSSCAPLVPVTYQPSGTRMMVKVQKSHVAQILQNLVFNARDAIVESGAPGQITISTSVSAELVRLEVSDSGPGMETNVAERAFEPYFTTKGQKSGSGMGLAIVSGLVLQSGGKIRLDTAPGQGSRFTIVWALQGTAEAAAAPPATARNGTAGTRVMFVDDEPEIRELVHTLLTWQGFDVSVHESGELAAKYIQETSTPPSLLISDVSMPGMDGGTLAQIAREKWPSLPILFVTGFSGGLLTEIDLQAGGMEVLEKPFHGRELVGKIQEMIAS